MLVSVCLHVSSSSCGNYYEFEVSDGSGAQKVLLLNTSDISACVWVLFSVPL